MSEDPLDVFANARTLYEYAGNSPLTFIDRCGLDRHRPELPRCFDLFLSCLRDWILPGASTYMEAIGSAAVNTRAIQLHNQALQHAAARGLRYPFRSSIFRGLLSNSRWWLGAGNVMVSVGVLDIGIGYCLTQEINAALSGQCR